MRERKYGGREGKRERRRRGEGREGGQQKGRKHSFTAHPLKPVSFLCPDPILGAEVPLPQLLGMSPVN